MLNRSPCILTMQHFWDQMDEMSESALEAIENEMTKKIVDEFKPKLDTLFYDPTNFFTCISSENQRTQLAQRGKNKALLVDFVGTQKIRRIPDNNTCSGGLGADGPTLLLGTADSPQRYRRRKQLGGYTTCRRYRFLFIAAQQREQRRVCSDVSCLL